MYLTATAAAAATITTTVITITIKIIIRYYDIIIIIIHITLQQSSEPEMHHLGCPPAESSRMPHSQLVPPWRRLWRRWTFRKTRWTLREKRFGRTGRGMNRCQIQWQDEDDVGGRNHRKLYKNISRFLSWAFWFFQFHFEAPNVVHVSFVCRVSVPNMQSHYSIC